MLTAIFMASGSGERFGSNKLIKEIYNKPIFQYTLENITLSKINEVIVITSHEEIIKYCVKKTIKYIYNQNSDLGQSHSIKLGVKNSSNTSDYMFFVADQPLLSLAVINKIINKFNENKNNITVPISNSKEHNPKIFPNWAREELLKLTGDKGGRSIIVNNFKKVTKVLIEDDRYFWDVDTIEDFKKIKLYFESFNFN